MDRFFICPRCQNDEQDSFVIKGFVIKCPCGLVDGVGVFDTRPTHCRVPKEDEE